MTKTHNTTRWFWSCLSMTANTMQTPCRHICSTNDIGNMNNQDSWMHWMRLGYFISKDMRRMGRDECRLVEPKHGFTQSILHLVCSACKPGRGNSIGPCQLVGRYRSGAALARRSRQHVALASTKSARPRNCTRFCSRNCSIQSLDTRYDRDNSRHIGLRSISQLPLAADGSFSNHRHRLVLVAIDHCAGHCGRQRSQRDRGKRGKRPTLRQQSTQICRIVKFSKASNIRHFCRKQAENKKKDENKTKTKSFRKL